VLPLLALACSTADNNTSADSSSQSDLAEDQGPRDTTAPELRDIRATLEGADGGTLDLNGSNQRRILLGETAIRFRIFADDDETAAAQLTVELVALESEDALPGQTAQFDNGLWEIAATAAPGLSIAVRVEDEAGNAAIGTHAAVFPSRAEALERTWTLLSYSDAAVVMARRRAEWANGVFCGDAGDGTRGGTYVVASDTLRVEQRHRQSCDLSDYGADWDTIEHRRESAFYVDALYFSDRPLSRRGNGTGSGIVGQWQSLATVIDGSAEPQTITESWTFGADQELRRERADGVVVEGRYELRENGGYQENFGDLILQTIERIDGAAVEETTEVHFYALRNGLLLIDPWVDLER
jgi:hypothetical protein